MSKLSVEAIEANYGITSREIRNAISEGHLEGERNHGSWLISEKSLEGAINQGFLKNRKQAV